MDERESLQIQETRQGDTLVLQIMGDMDIYEAPLLKIKIQSAHETDVKILLVDLSEVNYIDSAGLGALLEGHRLYEKGKGLFAIVSPSQNLKEAFQVSRLDHYLSIFATRKEAIAAGRKNAP